MVAGASASGAGCSTEEIVDNTAMHRFEMKSRTTLQSHIIKSRTAGSCFCTQRCRSASRA